MADIIELAVEERERAGKGAARAIRREGLVPGVIYGGKEAPQMISVARGELMRVIKRGHFFNSIFEVEVGSGKTRVLPRDLQLHPVTEAPLHVDLLRIAEGATIVIDVPVRFVDQGQSPGIKRGGVLNIVRHEIEVECPADQIPEEIIASVAGLDINDSVHISAITLPEGVTPTVTDRDFTVVTIAPSSGARAEAIEAAEAAEAEAEAAEEMEGEGEEGEGEAEGEGEKEAKEGED